MSRIHVVPLLLILSVGFGLGRLSSAEEPTPTRTSTVKAQRYQIAWADSALDLTHGAQRMVREIYLPKSKLAASLHFDHVWVDKPKAGYVTRLRVVAQPADAARNELTGIGTEPSKLQEIEVSAELAKQIEDLAKLDARMRAEALRLGPVMKTALGLEEIKSPRDQ